MTQLLNRLMSMIRRLLSISGRRQESSKFRSLDDSNGIINPTSHSIESYVNDCLRLLKQDNYDLIVIIPHCRMGGAAYVAGKLSGAIQSIYPDRQMLLIQTELSDFLRPDWFPDIERLDLSEIVNAIPAHDQIEVLLAVLKSLSPNAIFNVNSKLAWLTMTKHSCELMEFTAVYLYLFCYDINRFGEKVGYPIRFYPNVAKNVSGVFTDSEYMKQYLIKENNLNENYSDTIHVLYTPLNNIEQGKDTQKIALPSPPDSTKHTVFWAGRFDRQKRLDIVIDIARQRPDLAIYVWGESVLDQSIDINDFPSNMLPMGTFSSIEELPLEECDLWLYTSEWDGLPTVLIEIGARNVPIVSSTAGGTVSLIRDDTAWPVRDYLNVDSYIDAIVACLNTDEKSKVAILQTMSALVRLRHSDDVYQSTISNILRK